MIRLNAHLHNRTGLMTAVMITHVTGIQCMLFEIMNKRPRINRKLHGSHVALDKS